MGASHVKAAFVIWAGRLKPRSMTVLLYMAVRCRDSSHPPIWWGGWPELSACALGRPEPYIDADHLVVKRVVADLIQAGALTLETPATGHRHARYILALDPVALASRSRLCDPPDTSGNS